MVDNITDFEDAKALTLHDGDLGLFNLPDGGEIACVNGQPILDGGFETPVFISLFSGRKEDWWANLIIEDDGEKIGGEFESLIEAIVLIPVKLPDIEQAIKNDLAWFINDKLAQSFVITLSIPQVNLLAVNILFMLENEKTVSTNFNFNWHVQRTESLHERLSMNDVEASTPNKKPDVMVLGYENGDVLGLVDGRVINLTRSYNGS